MDQEKDFIRAVKRGHIADVARLLAADPGLARIEDAEGTTPLHAAVWKGHESIVVLLLDAGAEVNAQDRNTHYGGTPLHAAAHGNQRAVAALLIDRGADVRAVSGNGRTPLEETTLHKATAVAKLLREAGAAG